MKSLLEVTPEEVLEAYKKANLKPCAFIRKAVDEGSCDQAHPNRG